MKILEEVNLGNNGYVFVYHLDEGQPTLYMNDYLRPSTHHGKWRWLRPDGTKVVFTGKLEDVIVIVRQRLEQIEDAPWSHAFVTLKAARKDHAKPYAR